MAREKETSIGEKRDKVIEAVKEDLLNRSQIGIRKYGVTLERDDLSLKDWLQHAYEECLDQANYLKKAILTLEEIEKQEKRDEFDAGDHMPPKWGY